MFEYGVSQRRVARELGLAERTVTDALNKRELSAKTKQKYLDAINKIIKKDAKERDIYLTRNED